MDAIREPVRCSGRARWLFLGAAFGLVASAAGGDWPQWRGPNRDGKATGFEAPKTWPKQLTKKWSEKVGDGVATPALVGGKLYVFTRQGEDEVLRCLDAGTGKEVWQEKYAAKAPANAAKSFPGPRASPTVADGKVVTLGVSGHLYCRDAATGKEVWRKDPAPNLPRFFTSSSPLVADGLCVVQVGGDDGGAIVAYALASGDEKWKWPGDGAAYASPELLTVNGVKAVVAVTARKIVAVGLADGQLLWEEAWEAARGGYNSSTPVAEDSTLVYSGSGRGTKAVKFDKQGDKFVPKELWSAPRENSTLFNTPVVKGGLIFGLSERDQLFCLDAGSGKTTWTAPVKGGRRQGYGSIVDAGSVLFLLTPAGQLIVFEPDGKEFKQLASYPVGTDTYAHPVIDGNRVFVKDRDAVTLWLIE